MPRWLRSVDVGVHVVQDRNGPQDNGARPGLPTTRRLHNRPGALGPRSLLSSPHSPPHSVPSFLKMPAARYSQNRRAGRNLPADRPRLAFGSRRAGAPASVPARAARARCTDRATRAAGRHRLGPCVSLPPLPAFSPRRNMSVMCPTPASTCVPHK